MARTASVDGCGDCRSERAPEPLPGAALPYVTAGLDVRYLRPSPLDAEVVLGAEVLEATESAIDVLVWLEHEDKRRAEARAHWRRWRPR